MDEFEIKRLYETGFHIEDFNRLRRRDFENRVKALIGWFNYQYIDSDTYTEELFGLSDEYFTPLRSEDYIG